MPRSIKNSKKEVIKACSNPHVKAPSCFGQHMETGTLTPSSTGGRSFFLYSQPHDLKPYNLFVFHLYSICISFAFHLYCLYKHLYNLYFPCPALETSYFCIVIRFTARAGVSAHTQTLFNSIINPSRSEEDVLE